MVINFAKIKKKVLETLKKRYVDSTLMDTEADWYGMIDGDDGLEGFAKEVIREIFREIKKSK
jgi:hypothetical protein